MVMCLVLLNGLIPRGFEGDYEAAHGREVVDTAHFPSALSRRISWQFCDSSVIVG